MLSFPPMRKGLDKNIGSAHFRSQRMHQNAGFCIKSIQKHFRGSQRPDPRGRRRDICSHPPTKCWCPSASYRLATALVTGQRFRPGSLSGSGGALWAPRQVWGGSPTAQRFSTIFSTQDGLSWHYNTVNAGPSCSHWGKSPMAAG